MDYVHDTKLMRFSGSPIQGAYQKPRYSVTKRSARRSVDRGCIERSVIQSCRITRVLPFGMRRNNAGQLEAGRTALVQQLREINR